jgi:nucleotide-binding universal stress UspA family protein
MKQTWLVPLDGSEIALHPIAWILHNIDTLKQSPRVHLLNVQPNLPRDIGRFISQDTIKEFHRDSGLAALAAAKEQLSSAGIMPELHVLVGEAASTISDFADQHGCTQILIGTHGHSGLTGTLLGSVAMKVAHLARVPVLLIR